MVRKLLKQKSGRSKLLEKVEKEIKEKLVEKEYTEEQIETIFGHLQELEFIPLITFLASQKQSQEIVSDELIKKAVKEINKRADLKALGIPEDLMTEFIKAAVIPGPPDPLDIVKDEDNQRIIMEAFAGYIAKQAGIPPAEAKQAVRLIMSGDAMMDLAGVTALTARSIGRMPESVVSLFINLPHLPFSFTLAVLQDLLELPFEVPGSIYVNIKHLLNGEELDPDKFPLLDHTLGEIFNLAPADNIRDWMVDVLNFESVRLAVIIYARTQGIELNESDIKTVQDVLLKEELNSLLIAVLQKYEDKAKDKIKSIQNIKERFPLKR